MTDLAPFCLTRSVAVARGRVAIPRVFISYAHESPKHREAVGDLADWLRENGVDAITDHPYENRAPELGWQMWMQHEIEDTDVVLVVCSPKLKARYELREDLSVGHGAAFEGAIVTQTIYDAAQRNSKFFPILPDGGSYDDIPTGLRRWWNRHYFPSGNDRILRLIADEVVVPKKRKPFQRDPPGVLQGPKDPRLAPRESKIYGREPEVERVLSFLRGGEESAVVCAQVTGTGGIGKTEVCKAALKAWLTQTPDARAYYIDIPDTAGAGELVYSIGRAMGADNVASFDELKPFLREGLYYLDNLESVVESSEGQKALGALRDIPGLRILASSRVALQTVLGRPIVIDALPIDAAVALFRDLWTGSEKLQDGEPLRDFVEKDLGCQALSVALTARLGETYSLSDLVSRWHKKGAAMAQDALDSSRQGSLQVSLRLTSDVLAKSPNALHVWTLAALFPEGISTSLLGMFENQAGWAEETRQRLVTHHVWARRDGRFHMLPPVARYALDLACLEHAGFSWREVRGPVLTWLENLAGKADVIASTPEALSARERLLEQFGALHRAILQDAKHSKPDRDSLQRVANHLRNMYQFRVGLSVEVLDALIAVLARPAASVMRLGDLERRLGRPDEARTLFDRALKLFEREQSGLGQANTLQSLGDLERLLGRPDEARTLFDRALKLFEREQDGLGQANTLQSLGDLERRLGRPDEARTLFDRALKLYKREQIPVGAAYTMAKIGRCCHVAGHEQERDLVLRKAAEWAVASRAPAVIDYVHNAIAELTGVEAQVWLGQKHGRDA